MSGHCEVISAVSVQDRGEGRGLEVLLKKLTYKIMLRSAVGKTHDMRSDL